jgi:hypothetical protein
VLLPSCNLLEDVIHKRVILCPATCDLLVKIKIDGGNRTLSVCKNYNKDCPYFEEIDSKQWKK